MNLRFLLLASTPLGLLSVQAAAQSVEGPATPAPTPATVKPGPQAEAPPAGDESVEDDTVIVVTGQRARGSVEGDIKPEQVLDARDVRSTGATTISELLEALGPQIGSVQGRGGEQPVLLVNGKKVSGFRELRDIPVEAIERVDILPEEVGLKYGYSANQKVVNVVLRERFRSTTASLTGNGSTEGGYAGGNTDVTRQIIRGDARTNVNVRAEANGLLTENERDIDPRNILAGQDPADLLAARSLIGSRRALRTLATLNRTIWGDVSASLNGELLHSEGRSLIGLGTAVVEPLERRNSSDSAHIGFVLDGRAADWQLSLVGNGDAARTRSRSERDNLLFPLDRTRQTSLAGDLTATAIGDLFSLPAGQASATVTLAGDSARIETRALRRGIVGDETISRSQGRAAVNVDLPISRRNKAFDALGNLTLSLNAEANFSSDYGLLTKVGANAVYSPIDRLNLIASWSRDEDAPSTNQVGDPVIETPNSLILDLTRGTTVLATLITGGNPDLESERRTVTKVGVNWQPLETPSLRLRADYVRSRTDGPIRAVFGPTPTLEAAFPDRFIRNASGKLISADLRPINFDEGRRDSLKLGIDFSKPLKSRRPSPTVLDQLRAEFGGRGRGGAERPPTGDAPPPPPGVGGTPPRDGARRGGFGGRGGFFGGGNRGRLTFSLSDTITLRDELSIRPGVPVLDYLNGDAIGTSGGTPRHLVEAQAGWANNGLGARLSADWRSATSIRTAQGEDFHFSPLATVDLRLFATFGEMPELVLRHSWLRGASARFEVKNLFDSKPRVRDRAGGIPINYQADLLDPQGRTVLLTLRKLFAPSPATYRRDAERQRGADPR